MASSETALAQHTFATVHPASVLRVPDDELRTQARETLFADLRMIGACYRRVRITAQDAGPERGISGYPLMRGVVVMAVRSHLLAAATFGPYAVDERAYARTLWSSVPDQLLTATRIRREMTVDR